jgi:hypothetical protein
MLGIAWVGPQGMSLCNNDITYSEVFVGLMSNSTNCSFGRFRVSRIFLQTFKSEEKIFAIVKV